MIYPSISMMRAEEKFARCEEVFARHGLAAAYKIIALDETRACDEHRDVDEKLAALNYEKSVTTIVQQCRIPNSYAKDGPGAVEKNDHPRDGIIVSSDFERQWVENFISFSRIEEKHKSTFKTILDNIGIEKIIILKKSENGIAGCGYGAIDRNYLGIFDVVVKEKLRGKGYGSEIVEALLSEAAKRGVENSYLQVFSHNAAARHLYEKMGYREKYRFWFRKKGET
jgi:ribosomal protein S18 acetylase RimI-like enzyme